AAAAGGDDRPEHRKQRFELDQKARIEQGLCGGRHQLGPGSAAGGASAASGARDGAVRRAILSAPSTNRPNPSSAQPPLQITPAETKRFASGSEPCTASTITMAKVGDGAAINKARLGASVKRPAIAITTQGPIVTANTTPSSSSRGVRAETASQRTQTAAPAEKPKKPVA